MMEIRIYVDFFGHFQDSGIKFLAIFKTQTKNAMLYRIEMTPIKVKSSRMAKIKSATYNLN